MKVKLGILCSLLAVFLLPMPVVFAVEYHQESSTAAIAYVDEAGHIWVIQEDGGNARQITREGKNGHPVWSPDGSEIYFIREQDGEVFFGSYHLGQGQESFYHLPGLNIKLDSSIDIDPDGQYLVFVHRDCVSILDITDNEIRDLKCMGLQDENTPAGYLDPVFSPSGEEIALTQWGFESSIVLRVPIEGGEPTMVGCCSDPAFFPDGTSLVVGVSGYFAPHMEGLQNPVAGVYRLILDSGKYKPILTDGTNSYSFSSFNLSPDGSRMLYERTDFADMSGQIEFLDLATGEIQVLTNGYQPAWNKSQSTAQATGTNSTGATGAETTAYILAGDIWLIDTSSDESTQLTSGTGYEFLSWSPDGSILAASGEAIGMDLVDPETGSIETIGQSCRGQDLYPTWSPDGAKLIFTDCGGDDIKTRIVDLAGNQSLALDSSINHPVWSLDSASIYYFDHSGTDPGFWEYELSAQNSTFIPAFGANFDHRLMPAERYPSENSSWFVIWDYWSEGTGEVTLLNTSGEARKIFTPESSQHGGDPLGDWSPDGSQFVFQNGNTYWADAAPIYIYDLDSQSMETIWGAGGLNPRWSPDGSVIVFTTWKGGLTLIDPATGETQELIPNAPENILHEYVGFGGGHIGYFATDVMEPGWSPSGDKLTFTHPGGFYIIDYPSGTQQWIDQGSSPKWRPFIPAPAPTETPTQPPPTQPSPTPTIGITATWTPVSTSTATPPPAMVLGETGADSGSQGQFMKYGF
ncbi:hypothetical protein ACFLXI_05095, partial [Chloroflexota bacterium]